MSYAWGAADLSRGFISSCKIEGKEKRIFLDEYELTRFSKAGLRKKGNYNS